mmetsp:Transcript_16404/g.52614  ORF Transcript_16404/g.52614 Transcript_16404/m.52614 type:complete len:313 (+) Transcript_16404:174-1112(+)
MVVSPPQQPQSGAAHCMLLAFYGASRGRTPSSAPPCASPHSLCTPLRPAPPSRVQCSCRWCCTRWCPPCSSTCTSPGSTSSSTSPSTASTSPPCPSPPARCRRPLAQPRCCSASPAASPSAGPPHRCAARRCARRCAARPSSAPPTPAHQFASSVLPSWPRSASCRCAAHSSTGASLRTRRRRTARRCRRRRCRPGAAPARSPSSHCSAPSSPSSKTCQTCPATRGTASDPSLSASARRGSSRSRPLCSALRSRRRPPHSASPPPRRQGGVRGSRVRAAQLSPSRRCARRGPWRASPLRWSRPTGSRCTPST